MAKLTESQAKAATHYMLQIYNWANAIGDKVDPKRKHARTLAREFTALATAANRIRLYLDAGVRK